MRYWTPKPLTTGVRVGLGIATYLHGPDREHRQALLNATVACLRAQTHSAWSALIVHDGPLDAKSRAFLGSLECPRVSCYASKERLQQFGHPHRQATIRMLAPNCQWLGLTNDDNYYVPTYLEWLVSRGEETKADLVYTDMVHSHKAWKPISTSPKRGHLDLGGFLVRSEMARRVSFDNYGFAGDGDWINRLVSLTKKVQKVQATLFVHN